MRWWFLAGVIVWQTIPSPANARSAGSHPGDPYEIIAHNARLDIYPSQNAISCIDTLHIRVASKRPDRIRLQVPQVYTVEGTAINGRRADFKRDRDSIEFGDIPADSVFACIIRYSGILSFRSEFSRLTTDRAVLNAEEVFPRGITALREARLSVRVPAAWMVLASGSLVRRDSSKDSTVYVYEIDKPVPMMGWICAGAYWSKASDSPGTPISAHLFAEDSGAAPRIMSLAGDLLKFYGSKFSPYRFSDFKVVEVDDWVAGPNVLAVALPAMVMIKRLTLHTDDRFNQIQTILPHEAAHQWWPMTVFVEDEDIALLAEGMCDYSALLYHEAKGKLSPRDSLGNHPLLRPLILRAEKGEDFALQRKADLRSLPTHYLKAAYVHHMLRRLVGDSVFFRLYREFATRYNGKVARLDDFQRLAEDLGGQKLDWFVNEWVKNRGIPRLRIYNVKSARAGEQWVTRGRVRVVGYDTYTTFADVGVVTSTGLTTARVWLGRIGTGGYRNDVPFEIVSPGKPLRAVLDPEGNLLMHEKLPVKFGDVRDPANGLMIVGSREHADHLLDLARKDSAEMTSGAWSVRIKRDRETTLADLQSDRVFLYGTPSENSAAAELAARFPIKFRGDSVVIPQAPRDTGSGAHKESRYGAGPGRDDTVPLPGETVFDSTLALLQCIESPYIARGFLAWIAPLSERSEPRVFPADASWMLVRGKDEIVSGTWDVTDEDRVVQIK